MTSQFLLEMSGNPTFKVEKVKKLDEGWYALDYSVSSGEYYTEVNVVYFPIGNTFEYDLPIYILFDGGRDSFDLYKTWTPYYQVVSGLYTFLKSESKLRGVNNNIEIVDSRQLSQILIDGKKAIVIIPTVTWGIELVQPKVDADLIDLWVKSGGVLIWLSAPPKRFYEFSFDLSEKPVEGQNSVNNWWGRDVSNRVPISVSIENLDGENYTKITPRDVFLVERGFYGGFGPPHKLNLSSNNFISFQMKVNGTETLSLMYVELKDRDGNYRHYWLSIDQIIDGKWANFSFYVNSPDSNSSQPIDLHNVEKVYFHCSVRNDVQPNATVQIYIKDIKLEKRVTLISSVLPLTEAKSSSNVSQALNLDYGYVNLGPSVDVLLRMNGTVLGKVYAVSDEEYRTSIGLIPYGSGRVVFFGYGILPPYHPRFLAEDIMQIIHSGILFLEGPVEYKCYNLEKKTERADRVFLSLAEGSRWTFFAFSKEGYSGFRGQRKVINLEETGD